MLLGTDHCEHVVFVWEETGVPVIVAVIYGSLLEQCKKMCSLSLLQCPILRLRFCELNGAIYIIIILSFICESM